MLVFLALFKILQKIQENEYTPGVCSATLLATKRSAGVTPEVNLRECLTRTPPPGTNKAAHSGRSPKQGYQWPHKKNLCPPKITKKHLSQTLYCVARHATIGFMSFTLIHAAAKFRFMFISIQVNNMIFQLYISCKSKSINIYFVLVDVNGHK